AVHPGVDVTVEGERRAAAVGRQLGEDVEAVLEHADPPGGKVVANAPLEDGLGALALLAARALDDRDLEREVYELALVDLLDDAVGVRADHRRRPSARRVSSATSSLRNSPLAWKSLRGSQASAASSAASATASSPRSLPASACSAAVARSGVGPT